MQEHNLNVNQWCILDIISVAPTWCEIVMYRETPYFWISRTKIIEELKALELKEDTIYRHLKTLKELGFIDYEKDHKKDLIKLTDFGKSLFFNDENSEINPSKFGNKSEKHSEINPTYNNTSIYNNTIDKKEKYKKENLAAENLAKRTIDFLNQTVKKSFNYTDGNLKEIKSQINKLLKTGDTLEVIENKFAHVIRVKSKEWINNQEMKKHLNPVTLFRESKFDKYLNQDMGFSASDIVDKIYEARNAK